MYPEFLPLRDEQGEEKKKSVLASVDDAWANVYNGDSDEIDNWWEMLVEALQERGWVYKP